MEAAITTLEEKLECCLNCYKRTSSSCILENIKQIRLALSLIYVQHYKQE